MQLEGSKRDDDQDMAAPTLQRLSVHPGVLQTLCLNTPVFREVWWKQKQIHGNTLGTADRALGSGCRCKVPPMPLPVILQAYGYGPESRENCGLFSPYTFISEANVFPAVSLAPGLAHSSSSKSRYSSVARPSRACHTLPFPR